MFYTFYFDATEQIVVSLLWSKCNTKHILNQPFIMCDSSAAYLLMVLVTASHICNKENNTIKYLIRLLSLLSLLSYFYKNKQKHTKWKNVSI
jgi:hypothetical protein